MFIVKAVCNVVIEVNLMKEFNFGFYFSDFLTFPFLVIHVISYKRISPWNVLFNMFNVFMLSIWKTKNVEREWAEAERFRDLVLAGSVARCPWHLGVGQNSDVLLNMSGIWLLEPLRCPLQEVCIGSGKSNPVTLIHDAGVLSGTLTKKRNTFPSLCNWAKKLVLKNVWFKNFSIESLVTMSL